MKKRFSRVLAFLLAMVLILGEMPVVTAHAEENVVAEAVEAAEASEGETPDVPLTVSNDDPQDDGNTLVPGHDYQLASGDNDFVIHASESDIGLLELTTENGWFNSINCDATSDKIVISRSNDIIMLNIKAAGDYSIRIESSNALTMHCSSIYSVTKIELIAPADIYEGFHKTDDIDFSVKLTYSDNSYETISK